MAKARIIYQVEDKELDALQKQLDEIKKSNKEVEDSFKGSNEEIKKGGGALSDLKGTIAGLGLAAVATKAIVEFAKLTQEVNKNRKEVALLTNETGKALDQITAKTRATAQVFKKDFNEVLKAANTLSKEFNVSMTDAIDEINEGFTRGLDVNGDYLDTLREYSTFIKEAGLSTRQFNVLIQEQVQQGIFSDKGIDAIKEAVISIREMTPATQQAIKAIGIDTNQLVKDIQSGTTTYFEAVQQIATRTRELADPQRTGQILADIFRGAGEDAGNFVFTLDQIGTEFGDVTEAQQKYIDNQKALLTSSEDVNEELTRFSKNWEGLSSTLGTFLNKVGAETLGWVNDIIESFDRAAVKEKTYREELEQLSETEQKLTLANLSAELEKQSKALADAEIEYAKLSEREKAYGIGGNIVTKRQQVEDLKNQIAILNQLEDDRNVAQKARDEEELAEKIEGEAKARALASKNTKEQLEEEKKLSEQRRKEAEAEFAVEKADKDEFEIETDKFIKQFETKKDKESEFTDFLAEENKKRAEQAEEYRANDLELETEHQERKRELIQTGIDGFVDILSSFNDLRIQQINNELQANELARNRELELAEGNATKQAAINKKYDEEQAKLRNKQVNAQKQAQIFSAVINTARAVAEALPNIPLSILVGALGAAQIGFIAAQKPPKFAKGVIDLQGPGTSTSDSIPAYLSKGESVMTASETRDFMPTLKAIRSREIKPEIINKIVADKSMQNITVNDYDKLAEAVMRQPKWNINMDESGFSTHLTHNMSQITIKQNKFKM